MAVLVLGVALWWAAHLFKRMLPGPRALIAERLGDASKGVIALMLLLSVVLMVIGYRTSDFVPVYETPLWLRHVNNLLMFVSVVLFGMGASKGRMRSWLRHPMLTGFIVWAVAHLLVNGDLSSLILFGGLLAWALVEIPVINAAEPGWVRPAPGPAKGDVRLLLISVAVFVVIGLIHGWIGPSPFGAP
ncbi:hypothetical protein GE300_08110 [Rhodobacteraceae bacterium 2CG4]|uniref:NnrU domain-containing protein n=1 Tax=Halovulum marinum TaxID=2662447 RepID=A0A6L5YZY9_9RHOB|nr:NnrU family protein [Halovulum marinum]MSU89579.1 hypothetical protein [Halovulum marinum]